MVRVLQQRLTYRESDFVLTDDLVEAAISYCKEEERPSPERTKVIRYMERRGLKRVQRRIGKDRQRGFAGLRMVTYRESSVPF